jgi:Uma2 family endonuclease
MGVPVVDTGPMTVDQFFEFVEGRPDDEKWELIDGEPIMNATSSGLHQIIVKNLLTCLDRIERANNPSWHSHPGISVRLSRISAPVPDVLARPNNRIHRIECDDMIVAFEVLSPSTKRLDLGWKRKAYASLPSLQHYVVIAQDAVEIACFDRASGFMERRMNKQEISLELPALGVSLPLADIYWRTGLL